MRKSSFNAVFNTIDTDLFFNPEWHNGTGYFDALVKEDLSLPYGSMAKFTDEMSRRGIVIGTRLGNVVVFERFNTTDAGPENNIAVVTNSPAQLNDFVEHGNIGEDAFMRVTGYPGNNNIGQSLEYLLRSVFLHHTAGGKGTAQTLLESVAPRRVSFATPLPIAAPLEQPAQ